MQSKQGLLLAAEVLSGLDGPVKAIREATPQAWLEDTRKAWERAGYGERIDHRSLAERRDAAERSGNLERAAELSRKPNVHLGPQALRELPGEPESFVHQKAERVEKDNQAMVEERDVDGRGHSGGRWRRERMSPQREPREAIPAAREGPERERVAWQRAEERTQWERLQRWQGKGLGELERRSKRSWSELYGRQERQREQLAKDCRGCWGASGLGGSSVANCERSVGRSGDARKCWGAFGRSSSIGNAGSGFRWGKRIRKRCGRSKARREESTAAGWKGQRNGRVRRRGGTDSQCITIIVAKTGTGSSARRRKAQSQAGRPDRRRSLGRRRFRSLLVVQNQRPDPLTPARLRQQSKCQEKENPRAAQHQRHHGTHPAGGFVKLAEQHVFLPSRSHRLIVLKGYFWSNPGGTLHRRNCQTRPRFVTKR